MQLLVAAAVTAVFLIGSMIKKGPSLTLLFVITSFLVKDQASEPREES
jgi:hypothetical protein